MGGFKVTKVNQIVLMSKGTEKAKRFYEDVLGLAKTEEYDGMVFFQVGETTLMLHPAGETTGNKNGIGIEFRADHLMNLVDKVKKAGLGKVVQEPVDRDWGVRETVIEDPDGYEIWFTEPFK